MGMGGVALAGVGGLVGGTLLMNGESNYHSLPSFRVVLSKGETEMRRVVQELTSTPLSACDFPALGESNRLFSKRRSNLASTEVLRDALDSHRDFADSPPLPFMSCALACNVDGDDEQEAYQDGYQDAQEDGGDDE